MRNMIIEAKLQKLGVEKGGQGAFGPSESFNAHIRAASVRTPYFTTGGSNQPLYTDLIPS